MNEITFPNPRVGKKCNWLRKEIHLKDERADFLQLNNAELAAEREAERGAQQAADSARYRARKQEALQAKEMAEESGVYQQQNDMKQEPKNLVCIRKFFAKVAKPPGTEKRN